jgi:hypothetical protein
MPLKAAKDSVINFKCFSNKQIERKKIRLPFIFYPKLLLYLQGRENQRELWVAYVLFVFVILGAAGLWRDIVRL